MKWLGSYLKEKRGILIVLGVYLCSVCLIYSLYGLKWGPALYTCLLTASVTAALLTAEFFRYRKKQEKLWDLKKQIPFGLEEALFPTADTPSEQIYQELLREQEQRCRRKEQEARDQLTKAGEYYTRWSHQIKTPMAAMELLLSEEVPDKRALGRELLKTRQYVEMALQYQRLEGTDNDLVIREYDLKPVVMQAVKKVSPLLIHKKINLEVGDLWGKVLTDEKWLVFVLEQLLTNAMKYTGEGGKITVGRESDGTLLIRDTGIGIRPEDLPMVFRWGYTGYNGRLDKSSTGIGLALVKEVMDMLGHGISMESTVGEGTCVQLFLEKAKLEVE